MQLNPATPAAAMPLLAAADLQDDLLMVANDLARLQALLDQACDTLLAAFGGATDSLRPTGPAQPAVARALEQLGTAVVALQFQDMAAQLIAHTQRRLRHCTDCLAAETLADDEDGEAVIEPRPLRPNAVTQDEMDAGSVTLF